MSHTIWLGQYLFNDKEQKVGSVLTPVYNYIKDYLKDIGLKKLEELIERKIYSLFDRINSKLLEIIPEGIPIDRDVYFCLLL